MPTRKKFRIIIGAICVTLGYYLIYGDAVIGHASSIGVDYRDFTLSPGIVLIGVGLYLIINTFINKGKKGD